MHKVTRKHNSKGKSNMMGVIVVVVLVAAISAGIFFLRGNTGSVMGKQDNKVSKQENKVNKQENKVNVQAEGVNKKDNNANTAIQTQESKGWNFNDNVKKAKKNTLLISVTSFT